MRPILVTVAAVCGLLLSTIPGLAAKHAFLVGIDKYDKLPAHAQLQRAINDSVSIGRVLGRLGYRVMQKKNLTRSAFNAAWQTFIDRVNPDDEVAIFFSGHGIEIDGQNYLLPRDMPNVQYGRETQVKRESISLQQMLLDLRQRGPRVSLVILDACREHPLVPPEFRSAVTKGGLAGIHAPQGTFIMYSAGAGETALDRLPTNDPNSINSVYTRKLLPLLETPGLSLPEMATRVRSEVFNLVQTVPHLQRPAYYDGVIGRYCMAGCKPGSAATAAAASGTKLASTSGAAATTTRTPTSASTTAAPTKATPEVCHVLNRSLPGTIRLRKGMKFCDKSGDNFATVARIANRFVVFDDNGIKNLTCRQGRLCAFDWPVKPLFRVRSRHDPARGISPAAQMLPR